MGIGHRHVGDDDDGDDANVMETLMPAIFLIYFFLCLRTIRKEGYSRSQPLSVSNLHGSLAMPR